MDKLIIAVENSTNSKTGKVSATYAPIETCPSSCPFLNNGCYAQTSHTGMHASRLGKNARKNKITTPLKLAKIEADAIRNLKGENDLRLHVVGDCKTSKAAEVLAKASAEHNAKNGKKVWTYTHAWREIPREKFGNISVLASCETLEECKQAMKRGYAASIVRLKPFNGTMPFAGLKMTACKEITKSIQCDKCRMCMNDKKLLNNNEVICFFPHGTGTAKARDAILKKA